MRSPSFVRRTTLSALPSYSEKNKTIRLTDREVKEYRKFFLNLKERQKIEQLTDKIINQDSLQALQFFPDECVDLVIVDPPYNKNKTFNVSSFSQKEREEYVEWTKIWMKQVFRIMKPRASIYICSDWQSSTAIELAASQYFIVRNRITWEREKGRGAKTNWKNNSEDIWFCTKSNDYKFNLDKVKLYRRVIAPYRKEDGSPKDWTEGQDGNFRLTHPSNIWTDITVPFWSMPENTEHPTQKPEKLIAKLILASSDEKDLILDPFMGSGTTIVTAKKLRRHYIGIEIDEFYCGLAAKRLKMADVDDSIQGYSEGVFWERNSLVQQKKKAKKQKNLKLQNTSAKEMELPL